jgi:hypothetical protein
MLSKQQCDDDEPGRSMPHDFEFQLGRHRFLKGRGWRGILALSLLLIACVASATGISQVVTPLHTTIAGLIARR